MHSESTHQPAAAQPDPATTPDGPPTLPGRFGQELRALIAGLAMAALGVVIGFFIGRGYGATGEDAILDDDDMAPAKPGTRAVNVNTILPQAKSLVRYLELPATIKAVAEVDIQSKVTGYLRTIRRDRTVVVQARLALHNLAALATPLVPSVAGLLIQHEVILAAAPPIDLGSFVRSGDVLLEIEAPDLVQDVLQRESLALQAQAELEQAKTNLATAKEAIKVAEAQIKQAESDVKRAASEKNFRVKELERVAALVKDKTIAAALLDEEHNKVNAANAAWEASEAKLLAVKADLGLVSSKMETVKADVKVKAARVRVAFDEQNRARTLVEDARIRAPFDGFITKRDFDPGELLQKNKLLMTVMSLQKVRIVLQVPEKDSAWIDIGMPAEILVDPARRIAITRPISRHANALDPKSRTLEVEIDVDNNDRRLKPGSYVQVRVPLQKIDQARAIPSSAVFTNRNKESYILLVAPGNTARRQLVRIRYDDGREVEVGKLIDKKEVPLDGNDEVILQKGDLRDGHKIKAKRLPPRSATSALSGDPRPGFCSLGFGPRLDQLRPGAAFAAASATASDRAEG